MTKTWGKLFYVRKAAEIFQECKKVRVGLTKLFLRAGLFLLAGQMALSTAHADGSACPTEEELRNNPEQYSIARLVSCDDSPFQRHKEEVREFCKYLDETGLRELPDHISDQFTTVVQIHNFETPGSQRRAVCVVKRNGEVFWSVDGELLVGFEGEQRRSLAKKIAESGIMEQKP